MGTDTPIAVLSARPRMLFDYFSQLFAQVTNPPLDAIREEVVTSLAGTVGPEGDLLNPDRESCRQIVLPQPILHNDDLSKLSSTINDDAAPSTALRAAVVRGLYPVADGGAGPAQGARRRPRPGVGGDRGGARIIVLSDRESERDSSRRSRRCC